jgi:ATP-dependent exoDNAse (exonuclease V) beta subunit
MSNTDSLGRDNEARNRIVSDINTNIFVEAGAGSGKTTMLVSRMVAMVEAGIPIDRICAITFTKAAAGEFYDRFQKLLIKRSNPDMEWKDEGRAGQLPKPDAESARRCAEALQNIDLCFMGTIDSFCQMILSEHPFEAGIPSDTQIAATEDADTFYRRQYVMICNGECGDSLAKMARAFRKLYWNAEEVFSEGIRFFMDNRNVRFNYNKTIVTDIDKTYAPERDELRRAAEYLAGHPEISNQDDSKSRNAWAVVGDTYKKLNRKWSRDLDNVIKALKDFKDLRVATEWMKDQPELEGVYVPHGGKNQWYDPDPQYLDSLIGKLQNYRYSISMEFFEECEPVIEAAMKERGFMTFFDCLYYLRNMLKEDAATGGKLIRYIYGRHSYFLIDEFQDTNPMQAEVFFYLTSENPAEKWTECSPCQGSLFIVGDPKQSIYRFRSADVSSFLHVKQLFKTNGGAILSLSRNFRSRRELCGFFNRRFTETMPEQTPDQSKFEEIPLPDETVDEFRGIYAYTSYAKKAADEHPEETDPIQIGKLVNQLVDNEKFMIRDKETRDLRKIKYSDIMVITAAKKNLGPIVERLDELDIPSRVEGSVPFSENDALREVCRLYASLADDQDMIALYGALTGKSIGLTQDEIRIYRESGGKVAMNAKPDDFDSANETAVKVYTAITRLKNLFGKAGNLSPAALFAKLLDEFHIYEVCRSANLEVVYYTLELIRNDEAVGKIVSHIDGKLFLETLISGESEQERCLSLNDNRDAVHLANLHKVKGLEAPVVILASASDYNKTGFRRIIHEDTGSEGYLFNLENPDVKNVNFFETADYDDEKNDEKTSGEAEGKRLVYVAATRAENVLIVCDRIQKSGKGEAHISKWKDLRGAGLTDFFSEFGEEEQKAGKPHTAAEAAGLYLEAEETSVLNDRSTEISGFTVENPSRLKLVSKVADEQEATVMTAPEDRGVHRAPAILGTMTHKLMETLVSSKNAADVKGVVGEILREYRTPTTEPYEKELSCALIEVAKRMRGGGYPQTNGLPQDILSELLQADEVYCEVPFCYAEEGSGDGPLPGKRLWNGVMDAVYRKNGSWHIVDYKTNADGSNLDIKYQAQLEAYVKAFRATTGENADARTYHIDI